MPWGWGGLKIDDNPRSAPYHLVWARDLYQIATAMLAAGDKTSANRALSFLFAKQQRDDGSFPQNTQVDGQRKWTGIQMDQQGLPIVLAYQLGRHSANDWKHVRKAADFIVKEGPKTEQERWENQDGYSPGTIAAEIAGLVCAADIARKNGATAKAAKYEAKADEWQRNVERWTATRNGPYSTSPYYLRLTKDRKPDKGTKYDIGDSGPTGVDQRKVVDTSFLELVRLGVKRADDPVVVNTLNVIDAKLKAGDFWHRYSLRRLRRAARRRPVATVRRRHAQDARAGVADLRRRARRVRAPGRSPGERVARSDGRLRQRRRDAPRAGLGRTQTDRHARPQGGRGDLQRNAFGLDTRTVRAARVVDRGAHTGGTSEGRSRSLYERRRLSAILPCHLAPERGFSLPLRCIHEPRLSEHAVHGPRRRPDRCDPRVRGLQAPELPDQEVQAQ